MTNHDGIELLDEKNELRRPNTLNLTNKDMNEAMAKAGQKRIGFMKKVQSNYIDKRQLAIIESTRLALNEQDEKLA
jgi:hypothetical protein